MAYADVSLASTSVTNPVFGANTNFYFDSWVSGSAGSNDQSSRTDASATAALGSAASQTGGGTGPTSTPASTGFTITPTMLYVGAGAAVLLLVGAFFLLRK
jgi:hypothetical protein